MIGEEKKIFKVVTTNPNVAYMFDRIFVSAELWEDRRIRIVRVDSGESMFTSNVESITFGTNQLDGLEHIEAKTRNSLYVFDEIYVSPAIKKKLIENRMVDDIQANRNLLEPFVRKYFGK